jgi:hypothetical protein
MPLYRSDPGDFSQYDPYREIARRVLDYYAPGRYPARLHGPNVTTMQKGAEAPIPPAAPTRIDLAKLMAEQPDSAPAAPAPQPYPVSPGVPTETIQAVPYDPNATPGMPLPSPGERIPMPAPGDRGIPMPAPNENFHALPGEGMGGDNEAAEAIPDNEAAEGGMSARPELQKMAMLLAGSKQRPPFTQWAQFSPSDLRNAPWMT